MGQAVLPLQQMQVTIGKNHLIKVVGIRNDLLVLRTSDPILKPFHGNGEWGGI